LIWLSHAGFLYVDDFLVFMEANMMPLSATLLCIFCQLLAIPISWKKTAMHSIIDYIGWRFNFNAGIVTIPIDKILNLSEGTSNTSSRSQERHASPWRSLLD